MNPGHTSQNPGVTVLTRETMERQPISRFLITKHTHSDIFCKKKATRRQKMPPG
jgi:hypothetical protein